MSDEAHGSIQKYFHLVVEYILYGIFLAKIEFNEKASY